MGPLLGGRDGGAITAATFLGKFTQGLKWAHLDIAGTAYQSGAAKGSTGRPTALLADFLLAKVVRQGPMNHAKCVEFWGPAGGDCNEFPK